MRAAFKSGRQQIKQIRVRDLLRFRIAFDRVPPSALRGPTLSFLLRLGGASENTFTLRRA